MRIILRYKCVQKASIVIGATASAKLVKMGSCVPLVLKSGFITVVLRAAIVKMECSINARRAISVLEKEQILKLMVVESARLVTTALKELMIMNFIHVLEELIAQCKPVCL